MNSDQLQETIRLHGLFLQGDSTGKRANLSEANLRWANLRWANLRWANLRRANLSGANLRWADLRWADLSEADLRRANLSGANLRWADLSEADLSGANLSEADLREVSGVNVAACHWTGHGERGRQLSAVQLPDGIRFFCGCFSGTREELETYIAKGEEKHRASRTKAMEFVASCFPNPETTTP